MTSRAHHTCSTSQLFLVLGELLYALLHLVAIQVYVSNKCTQNAQPGAQPKAVRYLLLPISHKS